MCRTRAVASSSRRLPRARGPGTPSRARFVGAIDPEVSARRTPSECEGAPRVKELPAWVTFAARVRCAIKRGARHPVTDELVAWNPRWVSSLSLAGRPRTRRRERPMNGGPYRFESPRARPRAIRPGSDHQVPGRTASHRAPAAIQPSGRAPRGRSSPPRVRRRPCGPLGGTRSRRTSVSRRSPIDLRALSEPVQLALPRTSPSPRGCDGQ